MVKVTNRNVRKTVAGFARIATIIMAVAAIAPASAQAAAGGNLGKTVAKTVRAHDMKADIIPASLGGMTRSLPAGIYPASPNVDTSCFKAPLVSMLTTIQHKYGKSVVITSGFRSRTHNISAGGVKGSLHLSCDAADIKVAGVDKFELAKFVRTLPNRGGVGLYCHGAIHVDTGRARDWNWCKTGRGK